MSTDVVISLEHANLWPDEGNLLSLPGISVVNEADSKGKILHPEDSDDDSCALGTDGNDGGPAPLQTVQPPDVEFEGDGILSPRGTTLTYHQENVLPTGEFINMDATPYSWSLSFPTVFPLCYVDGKW
eukprot:14059444-Ditylum_brightwellii.AAC.1